MYVYSTTIQIFLKKIKAHAKKILTEEMHLSLTAKGHILWRQRYSIPLGFAVFKQEGKILGYYNASNYTIALNISLLAQTIDQVILNVLRHELAHMYHNHLLCEQNGRWGISWESGHNAEFKSICDQFWPGQNIGDARLELMTAEEAANDTQELKLLRKIKKLWALAESSNVHEAALAAAKANELLLRHHLATLDPAILQDDDLTYQKIIYNPHTRRADAKMDAIGNILKLFFVAIVQTSSQGFTVLSAVGTYENLQIAEYVAGFLAQELDRLWAASPHHGNLARNSFFTGVAEGFQSKIKTAQKLVATSKELMRLDDNLQERLRQVYPTLARRTSAKRLDRAAQAAGHQAGRNMSIHAAIKRPTTSSNPTRLLT